MRAMGVMIALLAGVAPARAADRSISDLFDPAVIARSICNRPDGALLTLPGQQLAAQTPPLKKGARPPLWPGLGTALPLLPLPAQGPAAVPERYLLNAVQTVLYVRA